MKGGDWGLAETLHRFGLPLFTIVLVGLYRTLKLFFKHSNMFFYKNQITHRHMLFSVSVVIYSVVASIHYTVWSAKSILPLFFIGLAIISRSFFTNVSSTEHS